MPETRVIDIYKCPHLIMVPEHWRSDGSCRCDDPDHREMHKWGYRWNGQRWINPDLEPTDA